MDNSLGNKEIMAVNIRRYLEINGITMHDLSIQIDVPYTTVCAWCKAETYPRIDKIQRMADYFNIEKADLVEPQAIRQVAQYYYRIIRRNPKAGELLEVLDGLDPDDIEFLIDSARRLRRRGC